MVARTVALVAFMIIWGAVTLLTAWRTKQVPAEYWSIPALGIGGILAAFATLGTLENRGRNRQEVDPPTDNTRTADE